MMAGLVRSDCYFDSVILSSKKDEQQVDVLRTKFNKFQSTRKAKNDKYKAVFCQITLRFFKKSGQPQCLDCIFFEADLIAKCFQTLTDKDLGMENPVWSAIRSASAQRARD